MKKIMLSLLLITMIVLSGCGKSNDGTTGNGIAVSKENGKTVISSRTEMMGGEYIITPSIAESEITAGEGTLMAVAVEDGKTRVAVTAVDGTVESGEVLFKVLTDKALDVKAETVVTEDNFDDLAKDSVKAAVKRGTRGYRAIANSLLGDFNNDSIVNISDFALFSSNYGTSNTTYDIGPATLGTASGWTDIYCQKNSDGLVNILDLIIFGKNYGKTSPTDIKITGTVNSILKGTTTILTANKTVNWAVSDSSVATLSTTSGTTVTVTGKAKGTVQITGTANGSVASYTLEVTDVIVPTVTAVTVDGTIAVDAGKSTTLTATVKYSDGTSKNEAVEWTTSDATVAKLAAASGTAVEVTGVKEGTATVTATKDGKSVTVTITVKSIIAEAGITVYVEKPDAWTNIFMWYESDTTTKAWDTTVLGAAPGDMTPTTSGWYKKNFPTATEIEFLFNNGSKWEDGKLVVGGISTSQTTTNFKTTKTIWIKKDGTTSDTDPIGPQPAKVSASQASGNFSTDGLDVTLNVSGTGVTSGKYVVNGTDASSGTAYTNGTKITVGKGLTKGQKVTLTLYATDSKTPVTVTYTYEKTDVVIIETSSDFNSLRMYQVMVATFLDGDGRANFPSIWGNNWAGGDLDGVIKSIDYIKNLGMNTIWLTPVFESNGEGKLDATGYFCQNYFKVDDNWGGNDKLKELITAAHNAGLYVVLDGVFGHHKGGVAASPSGYTPSGGSDPVSYPGSLNFYKEVATWWIDNYEIDGWRLDQAYQVATGPHDGKNFQDKNYWVDIRKVVEAKCAERKAAGKKWGTLGYMVGEIWDGGGQSILKNGYTGYNGEKGLLSCFDFPGRYKLVQTLAVEESKKGNSGDASALNGVFSTPDKISGVYPNMFIANHDVLRLGDLIQRGGLGQYWERNKAAMSFLAAYTGPITVYYGDEWGAEVPGYVNNGDAGYADDNCARSSGKISGFSSEEQSMLTYSTKLMKIRSEHPALWRGKRTNLVASGQQYADLKTDEKTGEKVVYLLNTKVGSTTIDISSAGSSFTDLETGATVGASVAVDGLSAKFLLVK